MAQSQLLDFRRCRASLTALAAAMLACAAMPAWAADAPPAPPAADPTPDDQKDIVVTGALDALPVKDVGSVFGFKKTLVETPRSASSVSSEQLDRFGITQIYDLV
ncbi:hypothetical protein BH10PSE15_BH10PSE15_10150 [soil metagenome]